MGAGGFRKQRRAALLIGALAISFATLACSDNTPSAVEVDILLAWDRTGVAAGERFTNDLGYDIAVDFFELTTYSIELIPCDQELFRRLQNGENKTQARLSFIGPAWAGHGSAPRPTRTNHVRIESPLSASAPLLAERLTVPKTRYCQAHVAIAREPQSPAQVAGNAPAKGMSLRLQARYRRGTDLWTPVALETPVAHGVLLDLASAAPNDGVDLASGDAVVITRRLATVFDGADFAAMPNGEIARQMMRQIVKDATARREQRS
jgi:hypothetical protein